MCLEVVLALAQPSPAQQYDYKKNWGPRYGVRACSDSLLLRDPEREVAAKGLSNPLWFSISVKKKIKNDTKNNTRLEKYGKNLKELKTKTFKYLIIVQTFKFHMTWKIYIFFNFAAKEPFLLFL